MPEEARTTYLDTLAQVLFPEGSGGALFWQSHARVAWVALVRLLLAAGEYAWRPSLAAVAALAGIFVQRERLLAWRSQCAHDAALCKALDVWLAWDDAALTKLSNVLSHALAMFTDGPARAATARHDFSATGHDAPSTTVYLCVPPDQPAAIMLMRMLLMSRQWAEETGRLAGGLVLCADASLSVHAWQGVAATSRGSTWITHLPSWSDLVRQLGEVDADAWLRRHAVHVIGRARHPSHAKDREYVLRALYTGSPPPYLAYRALRRGCALAVDVPVQQRHRIRLPLPALSLPRLGARLPLPTLSMEDDMKLPAIFSAPLAGLLLAGGSAAAAAVVTPDPRCTDSAKAAAKAVSHKWQGYSDKPVDACIGPYHFRFPMNHYYDQIGPDFQGWTTLVFQWPSLEAYPPGVNFHSTMDDFLRSVAVGVDFLERIPDDAYPAFLNRFVSKVGRSDYVDHPTREIALRISGDPAHGLELHQVDIALYRSYMHRVHGHDPSKPLNYQNSLIDDWYLRRDSDGNVATLISCTRREYPESYTLVQGEAVPIPGAKGNPTCSHQFLVPEFKMVVDVSYNRAFLPHWRRVEDRIRTLLVTSRVTP